MKHTLDFDTIAEEFLKNRNFQRISYESHHGITRMEHTMRVAKYVYKISKKLKLDYKSATRAAILHDFFIVEEFGKCRGLIQGVVHPDIALANAMGEFSLNKLEQNAIASHMFPLNMTLPKSKEAWVLTAVDKVVAIYEYVTYKFSYTKFTSKVSNAVSFVGIFCFNILTIGHK